MYHRDDVKKIWLNSACNFMNEDQAKNAWLLIQSKYDSPERSYHNLDHVALGLWFLEKVADRCEEIHLVRVAYILHEVAHDAFAGDSEKCCVEFVKRNFGKVFSDSVLARICQFILATDPAKNETNSLAEQLMHDLEFVVYALPYEQLLREEQKYREEYFFKIKTCYYLRRLEKLEKFLKQPLIFRCPYLAMDYEKIARKNIGRLVEYLTGNM